MSRDKNHFRPHVLRPLFYVKGLQVGYLTRNVDHKNIVPYKSLGTNHKFFNKHLFEIHENYEKQSVVQISP